jgi:hypothetical protein
MLMTRYLLAAVGESHKRYSTLHPESQRRTLTLAWAIHLPVALWASSAWLIASSIFKCPLEVSAAVSVFCALLIYAVERIVIASPQSKWVTAARIVLGLLIATLGASTVDLVVFDREIESQLQVNVERKITADFERELAFLQTDAVNKRAQWERAQEAANCEANGTCGSRFANTGPIYRQLQSQAVFHRDAVLRQEEAITALRDRYTQALAAARQTHTPPSAGLLERLQALHDFIGENTMAKAAWWLLASLVIMLELIVVFSKLAFGQTVDDHLEIVSQRVARLQADEYLACIDAPGSRVRQIVNSPC